MWSEQTNKVKAVKLNDYFYLFPCWFVFALPLPSPQLCAPLESSHLALVFAGHGAYVYYMYFKHSFWETDSSLWIPNTFYNQLHYGYWGRRRGNGIFFRFVRLDLYSSQWASHVIFYIWIVTVNWYHQTLILQLQHVKYSLLSIISPFTYNLLFCKHESELKSWMHIPQHSQTQMEERMSWKAI